MLPDLETPFIKLPKKYKLPLIIVLGFMTSVWSSCIFITSVAQYGWMGGAKQIMISTGILSFMTISFSVSFGLYWSFKQHDPFYILPWIYTKIIEVTLMVIGIILLAIYGWYAWLIFPAVVYITLGTYIIYCMYKNYKKLNILSQSNNTTIDSDYKHESLPIINTPFIACNDKMKTPFLIVIGLLVSFWANCIFNASLSNEVYLIYLDKLIAGFGIATYNILSIAKTIALFYGLLKNDPDYMKFWFFNKILDLLALFVGIILVIADGAYYWELIPVGIFIMVIGFYAVYCMRKQYNKMKVAAIQSEAQSNTTTSTASTSINTNNSTGTGPPRYIENPPHYEEIVPPTYEQIVNKSHINHI